MKGRRPIWTGLIVALILGLPFGVAAKAMPHETRRTPPEAGDRLFHAVAEQLDMSVDDLVAALSPLRNLERLANDKGMSVHELRATVRSSLQQQRKEAERPVREHYRAEARNMRREAAPSRARGLRRGELAPQGRQPRSRLMPGQVFVRQFNHKGQLPSRIVRPNVPQQFCSNGRHGVLPRIAMQNRLMHRPEALRMMWRNMVGQPVRPDLMRQTESKTESPIVEQ